MANYSLVVNSKFNPFTYEELAAPLRELAIAHQLLELKLIDLDDLASTLEVLALSSKDRELYNQYKFLADRIKEAADTLATLGLSGVDRGTYLDLKRYHNKVIKPIGEAYNKRAALIEELRKGKERDDSTVYDIDYLNVSLSDIMKNPLATFTPYSGNKLYAKGVAAGKSYSQQFTAINKDITDQLKGLYLAILQGYGSEYANLWLNNTLLNADLDNMVEDIATNSLLLGEAIIPGKGQIRRGIADGLAEEIKLLANGEYLNKAQRIANARAQQLEDYNLAIHGYKREDGKIIKDEDSPVWDTKGGRQIKIQGSTDTYDTGLKMRINAKGEIIPNEDGSIGTIGVSKNEGSSKSSSIEVSQISSPRIFDKEGHARDLNSTNLDEEMEDGKYKQISYLELKEKTITDNKGNKVEDPRFTEVKKAIRDDLPENYDIFISDETDNVILKPRSKSKRSSESLIEMSWDNSGK